MSETAIPTKAPAKVPDPKVPTTTRRDGQTPRSAHPLIGLGRSYGNSAVGALLRAGVARAKLRVGAPNDPHEAEADRVADAFIQAKSMGEPSSASCKCGGTCDRCAGKSNPEAVKRSPIASSTTGDIELDANREAVVRDLGPGRSLDATVRAPFEAHLGADFSSVRIHDGPSANRATESVGANAFTMGNAIAFNSNQFNTSTDSGRHLLAHELTHVAQVGTSTSVFGMELSRSTFASKPATIRRDPDTATGPATDAPPPTQLTEDDKIFTFLNSQAESFTGIAYWHRYGGLQAAAQNLPQCYKLILERSTKLYGQPSVNWLLANDARILRLANDSSTLQDRASSIADAEIKGERFAAYETARNLARSYVFDYSKAIEGYQQAGDSVLTIWEAILANNVAAIVAMIQGVADKAQESADERARLKADRTKTGLASVGPKVAEREGTFWNDSVSLKSLLEPTDGEASEDAAIAAARLAGKMAAVVLVEKRFYIYALDKEYTLSDVKNSYDAVADAKDVGNDRGSSTKLKITSSSKAASAIITQEGVILRPIDGAYTSGSQIQAPQSQLRGDLKLLDERGKDLAGDDLFRLFKQMTLDVVLLNLQEAEKRLWQANERIRGMNGLPTPEAGGNLQKNTAALRTELLESARLAALVKDKDPTPEQKDELQHHLAESGRIVSEDPTAAMLVVNKREADAEGPPKDSDVEDRLAGKRKGDAAFLAAGEIKDRLNNIQEIRTYFLTHPDEVMSLEPVQAQVFAHFTEDQQRSIKLRIAIHKIEEIAKAIGISIAELLGVIVASAFSAGAGLVAGAVVSGHGASQVKDQFDQAQRLGAMSALDVGGGFQLATPEQAANARMWAWIGLGLSTLDAFLLFREVGAISRVRTVLSGPNLAAIVGKNEKNFADIARQMGKTEQQLARELEVATGPEREALLAQVKKAAGEAGISGLSAETEEFVNALGETHQIKLTADGKMLRCSDRCMDILDNVAERVDSLTKRGNLSDENISRLSQLKERATTLRNEAADIATLPKGRDRTASEAILLGKGRDLERNFSELENRVMGVKPILRQAPPDSAAALGRLRGEEGPPDTASSLNEARQMAIKLSGLGNEPTQKMVQTVGPTEAQLRRLKTLKPEEPINPSPRGMVVGSESLDGRRHWRLDFDRNKPEKAVHINWFDSTLGVKKEDQYFGAIRIEGMTEDQYWDFLVHMQ